MALYKWNKKGDKWGQASQVHKMKINRAGVLTQ